ncbi:hypothetical protein Tco_0578037 [Tanacetum coccineum]
MKISLKSTRTIRAIGNEYNHDYLYRFHKLVNDMKITQLNIPTHQMNTKFVNNLPAYWGNFRGKGSSNVGNTWCSRQEGILTKLQREGHVALAISGVHYEEHLDSDSETEIEDNTNSVIIQYLIFLTNPEAQNVPTEVSTDTSDKISMIAILTDLQTQLDGHAKAQKTPDDLHKDILGTRNPGLGYMAKRAQPVLYDADTLLHPNHHPVSIWDSEEVLVHQVVSMKKINEKPGHVRPANDFYAKLNALMFVPQKDLSGDQAYWLSANEIASQASKPATPATPFVHKSRPPSTKSNFRPISSKSLMYFFPIERYRQKVVGPTAIKSDRIQLHDTLPPLDSLDGLKKKTESEKT